jgi:hypothetical protein
VVLTRETDKLDVVKAILVNLSRDVERWHGLNTDIFESSTLSIDHYFRKSPISEPVSSGRSCVSDPLSLRHGRSHTLTAEGTHHCSWAQKMPTSELRMNSKRFPLIHNRPDDPGLSRSLIERLVGRLEASPLPHLTTIEHAHLLVLIQTMLEVCTSVFDIVQS